MPSPLLPLLIGAALGAGQSELAPRRAIDGAQLLVQSEDHTRWVVVDADNRLWMGRRRLRPVDQLVGRPQGLHLDHTLVAWTERREGLWVRTRIRLWTPLGDRVRDHTIEGPVTRVISTPEVVLALSPGTVHVLPPKGPVQRIPLPFSEVDELTWTDDEATLTALDGTELRVSLPDGCPLSEPFPPRGALETEQAWQRAAICGDPEPLPQGMTEAAAAERDLRAKVALVTGDIDRLYALNLGSQANLERLRPMEQEPPQRFRTESGGPGAPMRAHLLGPQGTIVVTRARPDMDLARWVDSPNAAGCHARVVLSSADPTVTRILRARAASLADAPCGDALRVAEPGEVGTWKKARTWYVDPRGTIRGGRRGPVTPLLARLDLALSLDRDSTLAHLAKVPELYPDYSVGPGPASHLRLDVDGGWIADSGWSVVRATADGQHLRRIELPGPVDALRVRIDGRIEALVGEQPVEIDLDTILPTWKPAGPSFGDVLTASLSEAARGRQEMTLGAKEAAADAAARKEAEQAEGSGELPSEVRPPGQEDGAPPIDAVAPPTVSSTFHGDEIVTELGPWRLKDGVLNVTEGPEEQVISLGIPIRAFTLSKHGLILVTDLGLWCVNRNGEPRWRLTEVEDWAVNGGHLIAATPFGVRGYRLP